MSKASELLNSLNVEISRLRGCWIMADKKPLTEWSLKEAKEDAREQVFLHCCDSVPPFSPRSACYVYGKKVDELRREYLIYDERLTNDGIEDKLEDLVVDIKWDKLAEVITEDQIIDIKNLLAEEEAKVQKIFDTHNLYAGRDDVVVAYARMGSSGWYPYGGLKIEQHPNFLARVDDWFDETYCTIYFKIDR